MVHFFLPVSSMMLVKLIMVVIVTITKELQYDDLVKKKK